MFQILVLGDPKGALVQEVLASGILGDPGADSGGEGKSKQAEKYSLRKHPFLLAGCFRRLGKIWRKRKVKNGLIFQPL